MLFDHHTKALPALLLDFSKRNVYEFTVYSRVSRLEDTVETEKLWKVIKVDNV